MSKIRHVITLESVINGKLARELEYTLYGKLKDLDQLKQAFAVEEHEQWTIPVDTNLPFKQRLRLIDNRRYTMATKMRRAGVAGCEEVEDDIAPDMWRHLREVAVDGYRKTRYRFKAGSTGLIWEIDVFVDCMGQPHPWVKIDLEVPDVDTAVPELPVDIETLIVDNGPKQTMAEKRFIRQLWDSEWTRLDPATTQDLYTKED